MITSVVLSQEDIMATQSTHGYDWVQRIGTELVSMCRVYGAKTSDCTLYIHPDTVDTLLKTSVVQQYGNNILVPLLGKPVGSDQIHFFATPVIVSEYVPLNVVNIDLPILTS